MPFTGFVEHRDLAVKKVHLPPVCPPPTPFAKHFSALSHDRHEMRVPFAEWVSQTAASSATLTGGQVSSWDSMRRYTVAPITTMVKGRTLPAVLMQVCGACETRINAGFYRKYLGSKCEQLSSLLMALSVVHPDIPLHPRLTWTSSPRRISP